MTFPPMNYVSILAVWLIIKVPFPYYWGPSRSEAMCDFPQNIVPQKHKKTSNEAVHELPVTRVCWKKIIRKNWPIIHKKKGERKSRQAKNNQTHMGKSKYAQNPSIGQ